MDKALIEEALTKYKKDIVSAMTYAMKELGGSYGQRPTEEIHGLNEVYFMAHCDYLFKGNFHPLVNYAERLARKRAEEYFTLHELMRGAYCFKKAVIPVIIGHYWQEGSTLAEALALVDDSVDLFVVNLVQAYVHYAKGYLGAVPFEFPVWTGRGEERAFTAEAV